MKPKNFVRADSILYIMNVSWFWIKQRPQYLAEGLSTFKIVTVACLHDYNNQKKLDEVSTFKNLSLISFKNYSGKWESRFQLPRFNFLFKQWQLKKLIKKNRILWFTSPQQYSFAIKFIKIYHYVVYDCMDDNSEFYINPSTKKIILSLEKQLCKRANLIFTSAEILKERIVDRFAPQCRIEIVNNAMSFKTNIDESNSEIFYHKYFQENGKVKLSYIGTISSWFDFDLIKQLLTDFPNVEMILVGPVDGKRIDHPQIKYIGIVAHKYITSIMDLSNALIMPFILSKLILAVNPVKAYEYISSGKPVILTKYGETLQFEPYAYLYQNYKDLKEIFILLSNEKLSPKSKTEDCIIFAKNNTWSKRIETINTLLG